MTRTFVIYSSLATLLWEWSQWFVILGFCRSSISVALQWVPNGETGITLPEFLHRYKSDHRELLQTQVWGCSTFVIDAKLQNDQKLPKWNQRSRLRQFMGFWSQHSSLIALVRHLVAGYVLPQYHCVFDNIDETIVSTHATTEALNKSGNNLLRIVEMNTSKRRKRTGR